MYLSRLVVNTSSREFRRDQANIHDMHRTVMSAFPTITGGTSSRQTHAVLWRLDSNQHGFIQYVQSTSHPDWNSLPTGYLNEPAQVRSLEPMINAIQPGRRFTFHLTANPTRTIGRHQPHHENNPTDRRSPGTTIAIRKPDDQIAWLVRQADQHGFAIPTATNGKPNIAASAGPTCTGRRTPRATGTITIEPVRFDGHLIITDPHAFTAAIRNGIGRAKAYGCGLISLASTRHDSPNSAI